MATKPFRFTFRFICLANSAAISVKPSLSSTVYVTEYVSLTFNVQISPVTGKPLKSTDVVRAISPTATVPVPVPPVISNPVVNTVPIVLMTHEAKEKDLQNALKTIESNRNITRGKTLFIRIEDL